MVNSAIITVKEFSGYEIGDFELPIKMPVEDLSKKFVDVLKAIEFYKIIRLYILKVFGMEVL